MGWTGATYGCVGLLLSGEGVDLVRGEDVEARGGGVRLARDVPQNEPAAGLGVNTGIVKGGVEPVAHPEQGGREGVGGEEPSAYASAARTVIVPWLVPAGRRSMTWRGRGCSKGAAKPGIRSAGG